MWIGVRSNPKSAMPCSATACPCASTIAAVSCTVLVPPSDSVLVAGVTVIVKLPRCASIGTSHAQPGRLELRDSRVHDRVDLGNGAVPVRGDPARCEWIPDAVAADLRQVNVVDPRDDASEHRLPGHDVLAVADGGDDVEVLEFVVRGSDRDRGRVEQARRTGDHRIDGRAFRSGDVDAVVELEQARPFEPVGEHRVPEARAGIAEVRADRMLLMERLDRPRICGRTRARKQREGEHRSYEQEANAHGSLDGNGPAKVSFASGLAGD